MDSSEWEARPNNGVTRLAEVDWAAYLTDGLEIDPIATADGYKQLREQLNALGYSSEDIDRATSEGDMIIRMRVVATAFHDDASEDPSIEWIDDSATAVAQAVAAEREACALIADDAEDTARRGGSPDAQHEAARIAKEIRARSKGGA